MKTLTLLMLTLCGLSFTSTATSEEVRYVTDVLHVTLRSGKGNQFRIIHRGMPSSTKLYVLEVDEEGSWARVKNEDGKEGWVRSQYLIDEPTAAIKLAALQKKVSNLNNGSKNLLEQITSAENNNKTLDNTLIKTQQQLSAIESELNNLKKVSANAINLDLQHQKLLTKYELLQTESDTSRAEIQRLESDNRHNQWLFGALLLICGIIVTLIIQSMNQRRRKSDWG